jgi:CO dehydrogenase maturation factor
MTYSIALAGKGGTGKTTVAGMLVKYLVQKGRTPVLAVDADANANLNEVLGLTLQETLGEAREEMKKGVASGMTKDVFMQMKIQEAVVEAEGFDLIVMGRPEGAGCYCAANSLLTQYLDKLMGNYASIVIDNEAGMEHLSRMTTNNVDALLVVSDPTKRGLQAASRIVELTRELKLNIGRYFLLVNQAKDSQASHIESFVKRYNMDLSGIIPDDPKVRECDLQGIPTIELDKGSVALRAAYHAFDRIMSS